MPGLSNASHTRARRHRLQIACLVVLAAGACGAAATPASGAARPLVKITKAPPARTTITEAVFRIKSPAKQLACRRDAQGYRPCRDAVRYRGLGPGPHTFTARARHDGRTTFVRRRWTVVAKQRAPAPPVSGLAPAAPADVASVPAAVPPSAPVAAGPGPAPAPAPERLPGRRLLLADEFNGTTLDTAAWDVYDSPGHAGNGLRRPSAFSLDGKGNLVITAQMQNNTIVSGGMGHRLNFTYGRVEFRVRTEPDPTGTISAEVMTWPKDQWSPEFTENDIYETGPVANNTYRFDTFIHFGVANWQKWKTHYVDPSQWHTIVMEWHPDLLEVYVDGPLAFTITDPAVIPDVLHHVCIQLDATAVRWLPAPVRVMVDYIRVYQ